MALIIKGDMPQGCSMTTDEVVGYVGSAKMVKTIPCRYHAVCKTFRELGEYTYANERPYDCPIIGEIPDKHGDLKDTAKIVQWLNRKCDNQERVSIGEIIDYISNAPVVVEATE